MARGPFQSVPFGEPLRGRIKCALGHDYAGIEQPVKLKYFDMDGEAMWQTGRELDPARCIVCGSISWSFVPSGESTPRP